MQVNLIDHLKERIKEVEVKLSDLEKEEAELKKMKIRELEELGAYKKIYEVELRKQGLEVPLEIKQTEGRFSNAEYKDAILTLLNELTEKNSLHVSEIAKILKNGGIKSVKSNIKIYITTVLIRLKKKGLVENLGGNKWRRIKKESAPLD